MTFKIGMVGAPGSGKTTFAAMLYAELLKRGKNSSRLVMEKAAEHLGFGGRIATIPEQMKVTYDQIEAEAYADNCNFSPLICDGACFMGEVYMDYMRRKHPEFDLWDTPLVGMTSLNKFYAIMNDCKSQYDLIIYCPLINVGDQTNDHRIHNEHESKMLEIDMHNLMYKLSTKKIILPLDYYGRHLMLQHIVDDIIEQIERKCNEQN